MQKAVFLDRDGTINADPKGYISCIEDFKLFDYTISSLKILKALDYKIILVSNQSGIARGMFTEIDLEKIHQHLQNELMKYNLSFDAIYYCPFHPDGIIDDYKKESTLRKPNTGMFDLAHQTFDIERKNSWMIGDKYDDILFAHNAGLKSILVLSGYGEKNFKELKNKTYHPDFVAENLLAAANLLKLLQQDKKG